MKTYGAVYSSFWTSETIRSMSEDARWLANYLLSSPHHNIAGAFRLPDLYIADDLQWGIERVSKGLCELFEKGFCTRCEVTKWVWIGKFWKWNAPQNPNQMKAIRKVIESIPEKCSFRLDLIKLFEEIEGLQKDEIVNRFETLYQTLSKSVTVTVTVPVTVTNPPNPPAGVDGQKKSSQEKRGKTKKQVEEIFDHWRIVWSHKNAKLDKKRERLIRDALALGYTSKQLCTAITGCSLTPHNVGDNDRGEVYDGLHVIFRGAQQIERFMRNAESPPRPRKNKGIPLYETAGEKNDRELREALENDEINSKNRTIEGECAEIYRIA